MLTKLAQDEGVAVPNTVFELVSDLVEHCLPDVSPEELDRILALRGVTKPASIPEYVTDEGADELLGSDEAKAVKEWGGS